MDVAIQTSWSSGRDAGFELHKKDEQAWPLHKMEREVSRRVNNQKGMLLELKLTLATTFKKENGRKTIEIEISGVEALFFPFWPSLELAMDAQECNGGHSHYPFG